MLAAFDWDLNANVAMLQITQLQMEGDYEKVAEQFFRLVKPWLDIKQFSAVDLRPLIRTLPEIEKTGQAEARAALKLGIHLGLDDIRADEFYAMLILEEEREKFDRETLRQN
jgi:hypothetical protein